MAYSDEYQEYVLKCICSELPENRIFIDYPYTIRSFRL